MSTRGGSIVDIAERPLRRDAERNRKLILQVAAQVFAEQGLDAGFDEIARRAGVGVGTVYRRFPDRNDLISALFEQIMTEIVEMAESALKMSDPWDALCYFLDHMIEMQARDRGLKEVMAGFEYHPDSLTTPRAGLIPTIDALLNRAKAQGGLRADVEVTDLAVVTSMICTAVTSSEPELWRRYLVLFLDSLREDRGPSTPLPLAAPKDGEMSELMGKHTARRNVR